MISTGEGMTVLPQVTVAYTRLLYQFWIRHGVPKSVLDEILQVDIEQEGLTEFSISSAQLFQLHKAAVEHTKDSALGIKLGIYLAEQDLVITELILTALNLDLSIQALLDYSGVIAESGYFKLERINERVSVLTLISHEGITISNNQRNMVFAIVFSLLKKIIPNDYSRLDFYIDEKPTNAFNYSELLGCNIILGDKVGLGIPVSLFQKKNQLFDKFVHDKNLKKVKRISKKRREGLAFYGEVQKAIKHCLLENRANQENVAEILSMTVRNLQRRLKDLGINYQVILDETREHLAMSLLIDTDTALTEICYLLGFAEPSAFYKAFRRWTGKRPGDYRQDVKKASINEV